MRGAMLFAGAWLLASAAAAQQTPAAPAAEPVAATPASAAKKANAAGAEAKAPEGDAPDEGPDLEDAATKREERRLESIEKRRLACGCAMPRLLRKKERVVVFDGNTSISAWVRNDGTANLETFRLEEDGALTPADAPLASERFLPPATGGDVVGTAYELVRAFAREPGESFYLGVRTPPRQRPGDVIEAKPDAAGAPAAGAPVALEELWVGPLDHRVTDRCGEIASHRVIVKAEDDAPEPAGYLVTYTPDGAEPRSSLVDVRHARIFGLGRIDPCEHGMPFDFTDTGAVDAQLDVRTVSADFAIGPAWRWRISSAPGALPQPLSTPDGTELDVDDNPFLVAPKDPIEGILSNERDHLAFGAMAFVMLGAAAMARVIYAGRRRRGRHMATLSCPSCESEMAVDLEDPETDGMFCPKCGRSSVFVSFEADGTPKAHVMRLERSAEPPATVDADAPNEPERPV